MFSHQKFGQVMWIYLFVNSNHQGLQACQTEIVTSNREEHQRTKCPRIPGGLNCVVKIQQLWLNMVIRDIWCGLWGSKMGTKLLEFIGCMECIWNWRRVSDKLRTGKLMTNIYALFWILVTTKFGMGKGWFPSRPSSLPHTHSVHNGNSVEKYLPMETIRKGFDVWVSEVVIPMSNMNVLRMHLWP